MLLRLILDSESGMHRSVVGDRVPLQVSLGECVFRKFLSVPTASASLLGLVMSFLSMKGIRAAAPPAVSLPPASKLAAHHPLDPLLLSCGFRALGGLHPLPSIQVTWNMGSALCIPA